MVGLFSRIQGMFANKYAGRYMSTLLCELAYQDAAAFARIFGLDEKTRDDLRVGALQIMPEWPFSVGDFGARRADLAILNGGEPVLIVEVKENDVNNSGNGAQLGDYLEFVRVRGGATRFAHVSRYSPTQGDATVLEQAAKRGLPVASHRYRDFYGSLHSSRKDFCRLLCDYLKDIGVVSYKTIDFKTETKEIVFFLAQALGFPHKHGLGKLHSQKAVDKMPETLAKMLGNLEVLGEWVRDQNQGLFRHRFVRRYRPRPMFDVAALKKALATCGDDLAEMPGSGKFVKSGSVEFSAQGAIGGSEVGKDGEGTGPEWLACEIGVSFWIETKPEEKGLPPHMTFYACFYGAGLRWEDNYCEKSTLSVYPSEAKAMEVYGRLLRDAVTKAISADKTKRHPALRSFGVA